MVHVGRSTESTIRRQFEFRQIMAYIDEFKTFLRAFSDAGATKEGVAALAGRCGEYVKYSQSRNLFSQRQVSKIISVIKSSWPTHFGGLGSEHDTLSE